MDLQIATIEETAQTEAPKAISFRERLTRLRSYPKPDKTPEEIDALIASERKAARAERNARRR